VSASRKRNAVDSDLRASSSAHASPWVLVGSAHWLQRGRMLSAERVEPARVRDRETHIIHATCSCRLTGENSHQKRDASVLHHNGQVVD
jgi:hypothetical protein